MGPLLEALKSPAWFLVRNSLNILADVGDAACGEKDRGAYLRHGDGRVRRTAVRALWKLQGADASPALAALLPETDPKPSSKSSSGWAR